MIFSFSKRLNRFRYLCANKWFFRKLSGLFFGGNWQKNAEFLLAFPLAID